MPTIVYSQKSSRRNSQAGPLADMTNNSQVNHEARMNNSAKRTNGRNTITNYHQPVGGATRARDSKTGPSV